MSATSASAPASAFESSETITCLNCGHHFIGAYCPSCGQKHGPAMPTTKEIVGDLLRSALSPSGKVFETLKVLILKPGELSRAYLSGQRMRYVHPVRVYLLCVFAFVLIIGANNTLRSWAGKPSFETDSAKIFEIEKKPVTAEESSEKKLSSAEEAGRGVGKTAGKAMRDTLPEWMNQWLKARTKHLSELEARQVQDRAMRAMSKNYSALFAVLVPIMALVNWLLYAGRGISYAGHFVFLLHATAAGCLILMPSYLLNVPNAYFPLVLVSMAWAVVAAKRAFGVSLWGALWRYLAFSVPSILLAGLAGFVVGVASIVFID
jgi:Protein of unknown function (DUF3667)